MNRTPAIPDAPDAPGATRAALPGEHAVAQLPLKRALGPWMATAVVVGNVIGSGIFLKPGKIASEGGEFWLIIGLWVFGGLLCYLGALCYAELAVMLPRAGGIYIYLREAYGRLPAFLYGWTELLFSRPASIGALAVAFAGTLMVSLDTFLAPGVEGGALAAWQQETLTIGVAVVVIVGMAVVNILGVLWGGWVQMITTAAKAAGLALVALLPFAMLPFASGAWSASRLSTGELPVLSDLPASAALVLLAILWAYNGWHGITPLAEEVRRPERNIPLSLFLGLAILVVLYVSANFAYHGVLNMKQMAASGEHAAEETLRALLGGPGVALISAIIMCSTFGAINTNLLQAPRITFAMGRDGSFFRSLGTVHATFRTPVVAITVMAVMAIAMVLAAAGAKQVALWAAPPSAASGEADAAAPPQEYQWSAAAEIGAFGERIVSGLRDGSVFTLLTNYVIFSNSIFYALAVAAVIVMRFKAPQLARPYRTWGYPVTPILFILVYLWFLMQVFLSSPFEALAGLFLIAPGIPAFLWYRRRQRLASANPPASERPIK